MNKLFFIVINDDLMNVSYDFLLKGKCVRAQA